MRHDVHDVTVALDRHLLGHFYAAEFGDAPEIVAPQIDQHDVLGAFLWIGHQLARELFVFRGILSPRSRSGNRANFRDAIAQADVKLRRASDGGEIFSELETKHVRRRIAETNGAIKIERITTELSFEAL